MITREQQEATRDLERSQARWLKSYGWVQVGRRWTHPRLKSNFEYLTSDAIAETETQPMLGWPDRRSG